MFSEDVRWPASDKYAGLPSGDYTLGIRPHHVTVSGARADGAVVRGVVQIAEISGSESIVRVEVAGNSWVSQSHGVHSFEVGDTADLHLQVERCLYFGNDGALVAS